MNLNNYPSNILNEDGATVVITHRIKEDKHAGYEAWLQRIGDACRASPGNLDWHIIRPIKGVSVNYTVVVRFDTIDHLRGWMDSDQRKGFIAEANKLLGSEDEYTIHSGLDFWFVPRGANVKVPVRWKQFLVTWSAIYPLAMMVPLAVLPLMRLTGGTALKPLVMLISTGVTVWLMVYVVMPRYTTLVRRWLYAQT